MAARKKASTKKTAKKATRKKAPAKRAAGKKTAGKETASRKTAAKKPARKKTAARKAAPSRASVKKVAQKAAAPRPKAPDSAAIARKIIEAATHPAKFVLEDLYTPDCVSIEGNGTRSEGYAGLREKGAGWEAGLQSSTWVPRHVFTNPNAVAVEWDARITFKDGRSVQLNELAVHELRDGKIVAERFFYDPSALAPPEPPPPPKPRPPYEPDPIAPPADDGIDPMDL